MLPNSRIIPPTKDNKNNIRRRSNSASATAMMYESENKHKKGFISRLLANPNTPKEYSTYPSRPKYESVLGIQNDKDYATRGKQRSVDLKSTSSIKSSSSTGSKSNSSSSSGFGKLFKKRGKTSYEETDMELQQQQDDLPKVRPIHNSSISRKHTKIPLAPPPNYPIMSTTRQQLPDHQQFLSNLPDQYLTKRPTINTNTVTVIEPELFVPIADKTILQHDSSSSLRKSSGSYSIYSTFGGDESVYSVEKEEDNQIQVQQKDEQESIDSFNTVVTSNTADEDEEEEDDDDTTSDDDDDAFVDATGFTQEEVEREKRVERNTNKDLSKRLSGGHFGSAGGLLISINPENDSTPPPVPSIQHKRKSNKIPADDELAKSMLNWKRHSDSSKRFSSTMRNSMIIASDEVEDKHDEVDKHASTITVIDMRSAIPIITPPMTAEEEEEEEEELSVPDKMALRKKAEEALSGSTTPTIIVDESIYVDQNNDVKSIRSTKSTTATLASLSSTALVDTTSTAELFSKTLDDVWKTSDDNNLQLFNDPRTKQLQSSIQNSEGSDKIEEKIKETALLLWKEDESVVTKERMAEWLGQGKPFHSAVLYHYMEYFYFADMRLDSAFRKLCSKLYFKAEAQQIDRILESFANRYWDCNQDCLFGSADVVYAVVYSLLLLNTDLHVAQGNHARMTRSEFIRNTMSTIRDQRDHEESMGHKKRSAIHNRNWEAEVENYMKEMYSSVKQYQILQPLSRKTSLTKRGSIMGSKRVIGLKRSVNSIIRKSGRESMLVLDDHQQPTSPNSPPPPPPPRSSMSSGYNRPMTPSIKSPRRESFSSATSSSATSFSSRCGSPTPTNSTQQQPMMQYMNTHASSLFSSRPPYFKEGVVMRKHLLENASQKARHREWRECFLEVGQERELRMYALQQPQQLGDKSLFRHSSAVHFTGQPEKVSKSSASASSFGGPNNSSKWAATSQLVGKISLNHTLSNPLPPPGYNRQRPHVFAIQQSDGGVYLFQAASAEQTQEWVSTCNYWAARESKEPLPGGVGNMEYGWGTCLNDVIMDLDAMRKGYDQKHYINTNMSDPDAVFIQDWLPPSATMVSSQLDEKEQYDMLQKHLVELNNEINQHRDIKAKILIKFPSKCNNYQKVLSNWEARSKYLLHDIIKYQNYCDALEKSIKQRQQQQQQQEELLLAAAEEENTITNSVSISSLTYQTSEVDLFKEINQELFLHLS